MLDQTIRKVLGLYPRGATSAQLLSRLSASGLRLSAEDVLDALVSLTQGGVVQRTSTGRWALASLSSLTGQGNDHAGTPETSDGTMLAVPMRIEAVSGGEAEAYELGPTDVETSSQPSWDQFFGYLAATQRQDIRGKVTAFADGHGRLWQLVSGRGPWWEPALLRMAVDLAPADFRETLSRSKTGAAAIGWPISLFLGAEGAMFVPALILPGQWRFDGPDIVFEHPGGAPSLNPDWLRGICRRTRWTESELTDALFPEGEPDDLASTAERLRRALATFGGGALRHGDLDGAIVADGEGMRNAAAFFLPGENSFTRGAARDLEEMRAWTAEARGASSLSTIWLDAADRRGEPELELIQLSTAMTDVQVAAAEAALEGPLTVIQGPPGTGKSDVILTLLASAALQGRSVLFASKNHQALDEVERRLRDLVGETPLLTRGRDAGGERDASLLAALAEIGATEPQRTGSSRPDADAELQRSLEAARRARIRRQSEAERAKADLELCDLAELRLAHMSIGLEPAPAGASFLRRLWNWIRRAFTRRAAGPVNAQASLAEIERRIAELHRQRETTAAVPEMPSRAGVDAKALLARLAPDLVRPDAAQLEQVQARCKELDFADVREPRRLPSEDARLVLRLRPLWAFSTLSVPARVPLVAGLFDYVVFDEASQCDVASAIPLMARARRAVVVGDPEQLRFIPSISRSAERALMDANGMPREGRSAWSQRVNSLYDFAVRRPAARRFFLSDQFRSAPPIVDYLGEAFYAGKGLSGRREETEFRAPTGYKPGLVWEHVAGAARREEGGNVNPAEANRVADLLARFAADGFDGSVGVLSPFNAQVALIERIARSRLAEPVRGKLGLRVSTIDRFQGGEADVILFSPVAAPGAHSSVVTFLQMERRRINVAISRARALCLVVGDVDFARSSGIPHLRRLAERATTPWSPPRPPFDSLWERRLDTAMRARGLDPIPQYPVGTRYLDFALDPEVRKLDVEVDGRRWHVGPDGARKVADRLRDRELTARGWKVLRFWVHELERDMEGCLDRIERELRG
ncbi:MAG: AAA domain-containing protein [Pikeienuella sp.]|uniref:AAA domain-containing protein n=1 Tax=Pikeienuella sp. TaxID=2831957 RepID=UPI003919B7BA